LKTSGLPSASPGVGSAYAGANSKAPTLHALCEKDFKDLKDLLTVTAGRYPHAITALPGSLHGPGTPRVFTQRRR
jgi:hypothetical protein